MTSLRGSTKQRSMQSRESLRCRREDRRAVVFAGQRTLTTEVSNAFGCSSASVTRWKSACFTTAEPPKTRRDEPNRLVQFLQKIGPNGSWLVNPYWKCYHSCVYCVAHNQGNTRVWSAPQTVLSTLRRQLRDVPLEESLLLGACADPYPPIEEHLGLTRTILMELRRQKRPLGYVGTKSGLICRDIDVLRDFGAQCSIHISLCSLDDRMLRRLEPGAPAAADRLDAMQRLSQAGLTVVYDCIPWTPTMSDAEAAWAARPPGVRMLFSKLDVKHVLDPSVLKRNYTQREIDRLYAQAHRRFGDRELVEWEQ